LANFNSIPCHGMSNYARNLGLLVQPYMYMFVLFLFVYYLLGEDAANA